jgi:hypothetical protein
MMISNSSFTFTRFSMLTFLLTTISVPAAAVPVLYLDEAAFNNALSGSLSEQGFNTVSSGFETYLDNPQTFGDVTVSSSKFKVHSDSRFVSEGTSAIYAAPANTAGDYGPITFTFDSSINALSFDVLDLGSSIDPSSLTLMTDEGDVIQVAGNYAGVNGSQFFAGIIDFESSFTSVTFDLLTEPGSLDDIVSFDRFRYGYVDTQEVPLPAGLPLYLLSLSLLAFFKRKA